MKGIDLMLLGLAVIALPFIVMVFLAAGPLLWFGLGLSLIIAGILVTLQSSEGGEEHVPPRNCPECGSPNDPDETTCTHCRSAL